MTVTFHVGDRVKCVCSAILHSDTVWAGTVVGLIPNRGRLLVKWDFGTSTVDVPPSILIPLKWEEEEETVEWPAI